MMTKEKQSIRAPKVTRKGLTSAEAERSRSENGSNEISKKKRKSFLSHFFSNLGDPVTRILLFALGINLIFVFWGGDILETVGIGISVFLAALISTLSERGSEAAFERLSRECASVNARVYRDGHLCELPIGEIVVGDRVLVSAGEGIPADGYIVSGKIGVDQSAMTGENREVEKLPSNDIGKGPNSKSATLRGCSVLSGEGELEIFSVGDESFLGKISREVQTDTRDSPLKIRLSRLARQISRIGYIAAFLVAAAFLLKNFVIDSGMSSELMLEKLRAPTYLFDKLLHAFMLGLTVIVVAVPEGLPMMIAVVLSSNIRRMIKDNVLVRRPVGIEAAGSMDILFTDKTGTLTEGKMGVGGIFLADGGEFRSPDRLFKDSPKVGSLYRLSCRFNTSSKISGKDVIGGNSTEKALCESVLKFGLTASEGRVSVIERLPFDSASKYSAVRLSGSDCRALIKGAPEKLLPHIKYAYGKDGRAISFAEVSYPFMKKIHTLTSEGGRVIFIAESSELPKIGRFSELTLVCAVLLNDNIRKEAKTAVKTLTDAGVQVVMITGDSKETAQRIAKDTGILSCERTVVLSGEELARISDEELKRLLPRLAVVARALPTDKSRLVLAAQSLDKVVGMTGDGINDAPALKLADIGFSMGSGTQVARDAGDIIILDDNLSSIAKAVLYGRTIFKSIRKFIALQLTMNFCAVGVSMIGPFVGVESPVTVVQMLWINIIMDTLGGLAFAGEAPSAFYMREKPKKRDEPILNSYMINQIVVLGGFTVAACMAFLKIPRIYSNFRTTDGSLCLMTAFFALFIFMSVFNCFNSRTDRIKPLSGLSKNTVFIFIMLLVSFVQIFFVYLGGSVLRTMPLTRRELIYTLTFASSVIPVELMRKIIWRLSGEKEGF